MRDLVRLAAGISALAALLVAPAPGAAFTGIIGDGGTPVRLLDEVIESREAALVALGELAFKSREILGVSQFSCDTCHPDGRASRKFFFPGLSDRPGNVDVTNQVLTHIEDGLFNPINIPSLIGIRHTAPYGRDGRFPELVDFTLFAIVNEFAGPNPSDLALDALVAFQESLDFPDNPALDAEGRLTAAAPEAARRGEVLFRRPFPDDPGLSCAGCHVPANHFRDGLIHDIGTGRAGKAGKEFETPTLLETGQSAPYFHDGRYDGLDEVVDYFDSRFRLGMTAAERADLTAYLETVGAGVSLFPEPGDDVHPATAVTLLEMTLEGEDYFLTDLVVELVVVELGRHRRGIEGPAADAVTGWIAALRRMEPLAARGDFEGAWLVLDELRGMIGDHLSTRAAAR